MDRKKKHWSPVLNEISLLLIQTILNEYQLSFRGVHGITHWARVLENGLRLASLTGAQTLVVRSSPFFTIRGVPMKAEIPVTVGVGQSLVKH